MNPGYYRAKDETPLKEMIDRGECGFVKGGLKVLPIKRVGSKWDPDRQLVQIRFMYLHPCRTGREGCAS